MDRTSIIILVVCFALFVLWSVHMQRYYSSRPTPRRAESVPTTTATTTNQIHGSVPADRRLPVPTTSAAAFVRPDKPEELVVLTNELARYTFTSHGGGIKLVELVRYPQATGATHTAHTGTNQFASLNSHAPAPVLALLGETVIQGDGMFELTRTHGGVEAKQLHTNGLVIVKRFEPSSNYLLRATVELQNTGTQALILPRHEVVIGTATPMDAEDDGTYVNVLWYNGSKTEQIGGAWFENRVLGCFPGTPRQVYRGGATDVFWAAANNRFFALAIMPTEPAHELVAVPVTLPPPDATSQQERKSTARSNVGYQAALVNPEMTLAPGQTVTLHYQLFAGPKEYRMLARIGAAFNNNLQAIMGFERVLGGRFTAFFAKLLLVSMNGLHDLLRLGYGWLIIIITFIIKVLFWPLTQASMRSMRRMQELQPQIKALQEKYKDDPPKLNRKMMEFWKENKINPFGGCLPMLLQMPVFIGFYVMIQSAIELRGARFLWVRDLSKPDTLFLIPGLNFLPFISTPDGLPFNLLPLLMGATMLWQSHMTPATPGADPMQQKLMRWMPLFFLLFLYNFSAGLTLYWTVQNLLSIAQMKLTKPKQTAPVTPTNAQVKAVPFKRKK